MSILEIPGHDRDAIAADFPDAVTADEFAQLLVDEFGATDVAAVDMVGFDDARVILDAIAYDEWAAADDDASTCTGPCACAGGHPDEGFWPTADDRAIERLAVQG